MNPVLTDIEMKKLCAAAMGLSTFPDGMIENTLYDHADGDEYDPLTNDEQAMALVKKLRLRVAYNIFVGCWVASTLPDNETGDKEARFDESLNAAIVKCAAQAQAKLQFAAGDADK